MSDIPSHDVTQLLKAWSGGDQQALNALMPTLYAEIRKIAASYLRRERPDHTLQPTALVNEAYMRLVDQSAVQWQNRAHFFATAAPMMRRVLVDAARARRATKRGDGIDAVPLDEMEVAAPGPRVDVIALEDALDALAAVNPRAAQVVELRFFGGFSVEETAHALDMSVRTVINDWNTARVWLYRELATSERR